MKKHIILYKPRSLDDRVELELVEGETPQKVMFKWLEDNRGTLKHHSGYSFQEVSEEDEKLFLDNYEEFRSKYFKPSKYFDYD